MPTSPADPKRVVEAFLRSRTASQMKTAGEVRFVKDRGGDKSEWAWATPGPTERQLGSFTFKPKFLKPLAQTLRSTLMALGHATSAHARLVKIKSRNVSPDGSLGGRGYIQKISELRRQLMNVVEVLSATSDTLYDEIQAPHWAGEEDKLDVRDRDEVREIIENAEEIKEDPEGWAVEEEAEELEQSGEKEPEKMMASGKKKPRGKRASAEDLPALLNRVSVRVASFVNIEQVMADPVRIAQDLGEICADLQVVSRSIREL